MKQIKLMEHNIFQVRAQASYGGVSKISKWLIGKIYGEAFLEKSEYWIKSLDPKNTYVTIVKDKSKKTGGANIDDYCKQGCPFIQECEVNSMYAIQRVFTEKSKILGVIMTLFGIYNYLSRNNSLKNLQLETGKEYTLQKILT